MGYYINIVWELVPRKKVDFSKIESYIKPEWGLIYHAEDKVLEMDDWYVKEGEWFNEMVEFILKYYDGYIWIDGEDSNDRRRLHLQNGNITLEDGDVIYGDVLKFCLENYELPEKLKEELKLFIIAKEV